MPELPDLTVYAENLHRLIAGRKIAAVNYHKDQGLNVSVQQLSNALKQCEVERVERSGKEICIRVSNGSALYIHLMLTGGFVVTTESRSLPFPIFTLNFSDGSSLLVNDPKGWAKIRLNPESEGAAVDALGITVDYLKQTFAKKPKMLAKAFLIDQQLIRGIGNAYADEILWAARISPKSAVGKLPPEVVQTLADTIPTVLNEATEHLRSNYPGIISGEVRDFLKIHNPSLELSPTGHPILKETVSSKTTYFTDEQRLYR